MTRSNIFIQLVASAQFKFYRNIGKNHETKMHWFSRLKTCVVIVKRNRADMMRT